MPARKRTNPRTQLQTFRTIRVSEPLRTAIKRRRKQLDLTLYDFVKEAAAELAPLTREVERLGLPAARSTDRPARLPLDDALIEMYRQASQSTGIPATRLLLATLQRAAQRKRRRGASH